MSSFNYKTILLFVALSFLCITFLIVPTNPDHSFILLPEGIALIVAGLILYSRSFKKSVIHISTTELTIGMLFLFNQLALMTFRMITSASTLNVRATCAKVGGFLYRSECLMTLAGANPFRSLSFLISASLLFVIFYLFVKSYPKMYRFIWIIPATGLVVVIFAELYANVFGYTSALPLAIGRAEFGSDAKMGALFTNHGWTWPFVSMSAVLSVWYLFRITPRSTFLQRLAAIVFAICAFGTLFLNQQRGGWLLAFTLLVTAILRVAVAKSSKKYFLYTFVSVCLIVLGIFFVSKYSGVNAPFPLNLLVKNPLSLSTERFIIWEEGWKLFNQSPWFGFGYGSWSSVAKGSEILVATHLAFDTAHNWFVQSLVELGVLHTSLYLVMFLGMVYVSHFNAPRSQDGSFLLILSAVSALVITSVQEIDYIRPTFYLHAVFWGFLVAGHREADPQKDVALKRAPKVFAMISFFIGLMAVTVFVTWFQWGAYGYEGTKNSPRIGRWIQKTAYLVIGKGTKTYSVFPTEVNSSSASKLISVNIFGEEQSDYELQGIAYRLVGMPFLNSQFGLQRYKVHIEQPFFEKSRNFGSRIRYPALQSNLALVNIKQTLLATDREPVYSCLGSCEFYAQSCGRNDDLRLGLSIAHQREADSEVEVDLVHLDPSGTQMFYRQSIGLTSRAPIYQVQLEPKSSHKWQRLRIIASENTSDIQILETDCIDKDIESSGP